MYTLTPTYVLLLTKVSRTSNWVEASPASTLEQGGSALPATRGCCIRVAVGREEKGGGRAAGAVKLLVLLYQRTRQMLHT